MTTVFESQVRVPGARVRPRSFRLILLAVAASSLVLTACGQHTQPTEYGEAYEANFMTGCHSQKVVPGENPKDTTVGPQSSKDFCKCVYDGLVKKVPFEEAKKFEEQQATESAGNITVPKSIKSIIDGCAKQS